MHENQKKNAMQRERSIDLTRLVKAVAKRLWLIVIVSVLCGIVVFAGAKMFMTPMYRSSFTAYVNNRTDSQNTTTSADLTASIGLTYVYQEIVLSRSVLMTAAEQCGLDYKYESLKGRVSFELAATSAYITVSVSSADPEEAVQLAQAIARVAPEQVSRVVENSSMRIVDDPVKPERAYAPNCRRLAALGAIGMFVLLTAVVVLVDIVSDKVESAKELEDRYDIAVVGIIPDMAHADKYAYGTYGAYASKARRK